MANCHTFIEAVYATEPTRPLSDWSLTKRWKRAVKYATHFLLTTILPRNLTERGFEQADTLYAKHFAFPPLLCPPDSSPPAALRAVYEILVNTRNMAAANGRISR